MYDTQTEEWTEGVPMLRQRVHGCAVALAGKIYVVGGMTVRSHSPDYTQGVPGLNWDYEHVSVCIYIYIHICMYYAFT